MSNIEDTNSIIIIHLDDQQSSFERRTCGGALHDKDNMNNTRLEGRKYNYTLKVDPLDGDKALDFRPLSLARPHMRSFWYANIINRATIFMWFSAVPLYDQIQATLGLTKDEIWISSIYAIIGVLLSRFLVGIVCDRYGARIPIYFLCLFASIPCALQGIVTSAMGLNITRFFLGLGGGVYVGITFWMDNMFKKESLGRIHGFTAGTGLAMAMGQGAIRIAFFPFLEYVLGSSELAWRACFSLISLGTIIVTLPMICLTDDTPRGNFSKLKKQGDRDKICHWKNFTSAIMNINVIFLCIQHACNLGIEIVACSMLNLYFIEKYDVPAPRAILLLALFSGSNQMARVMGGRLSDFLCQRYGLEGRLKAQFVFLLISGISLVCFALVKELKLACAVLAVTAVFTFISQSFTNSITPYLSPDSNSMITGLIGASGVAGALGFSFIFQHYQYDDAFKLTGLIIMLASFLTLFMHAPGYGYLFFRTTDKDYTKRLKSEKGICSEYTHDTNSTESSFLESSGSDHLDEQSDDLSSEEETISIPSGDHNER